MGGARVRVWLGIALVALVWASAACAGTGTATVDAHLVVRSLDRPAGRQAARLEIVLPAPAGGAAGPAVVQLALGAHRVELPAALHRDGVLVARARRLTIPGVDAAGGARLDVAGSVAGSFRFEPGACRLVRRGATFDCRGAAVMPLPDGPDDGVFDMTLRPGGSVSLDGVAALRTGSLGRTLELVPSEFDVARLAVTERPDGAWDLAGNAVLAGDIVVPVSGTASAIREAAAWRITGAVSLAVIGETWTFTLRRPDAGTPSGFGGDWILELDSFAAEPDRLPLSLEVPASGFATTAPTSVSDPSGTPTGSVAASSCLVAPGGGLSCVLPFDGPPSGAIFLHGTLPSGADAGGGRFIAGAPPVLRAQGVWRATRP